MDLTMDERMNDWLHKPPEQLICNGKPVNKIAKNGLSHIVNRTGINNSSLLKKINKKDTETEIKVLSDAYRPTNFLFYNQQVAKKKIFFLHIPKTAGSSLNQMLAENFKKRKTKVHIETDRQNNYNSVNPKKLDFISGHIRLYNVINQFSLNNFLRITILREPYDQLISHINWVKFIGADPNSTFFKGHSTPLQELSLFTKKYNFEQVKEVEKFVNELPPLGYRLFNNCQTRFLNNHQSPEVISGESATESIKTLSYFDEVGTVEHIDLFMQKIYQKMDWGKPPKIARTNELNNRYKIPKDSEVLRKVLAPLFKEDQQIYNHVNAQIF